MFEHLVSLGIQLFLHSVGHKGMDIVLQQSDAVSMLALMFILDLGSQI
jgi:hypothetical protein